MHAPLLGFSDGSDHTTNSTPHTALILIATTSRQVSNIQKQYKLPRFTAALRRQGLTSAWAPHNLTSATTHCTECADVLLTTVLPAATLCSSNDVKNRRLQVDTLKVRLCWGTKQALGHNTTHILTTNHAHTPTTSSAATLCTLTAQQHTPIYCVRVAVAAAPSTFAPHSSSTSTSGLYRQRLKASLHAVVRDGGAAAEAAAGGELQVKVGCWARVKSRLVTQHMAVRTCYSV